MFAETAAEGDELAYCIRRTVEQQEDRVIWERRTKSLGPRWVILFTFLISSTETEQEPFLHSTSLKVEVVLKLPSVLAPNHNSHDS